MGGQASRAGGHVGIALPKVSVNSGRLRSGEPPSHRVKVLRGKLETMAAFEEHDDNYIAFQRENAADRVFGHSCFVSEIVDKMVDIFVAHSSIWGKYRTLIGDVFLERASFFLRLLFIMMCMRLVVDYDVYFLVD